MGSTDCTVDMAHGLPPRSHPQYTAPVERRKCSQTPIHRPGAPAARVAAGAAASEPAEAPATPSATPAAGAAGALPARRCVATAACTRWALDSRAELGRGAWLSADGARARSTCPRSFAAERGGVTLGFRCAGAGGGGPFLPFFPFRSFLTFRSPVAASSVCTAASHCGIGSGAADAGAADAAEAPTVASAWLGEGGVPSSGAGRALPSGAAGASVTSTSDTLVAALSMLRDSSSGPLIYGTPARQNTPLIPPPDPARNRQGTSPYPPLRSGRGGCGWGGGGGGGQIQLRKICGKMAVP